MSDCWDRPTARIHRVTGFGVDPDPERPGWVDWRVVRTGCGLNIALVANPDERPPSLTRCPGCFAT